MAACPGHTDSSGRAPSAQTLGLRESRVPTEPWALFRPLHTGSDSSCEFRHGPDPNLGLLFPMYWVVSAIPCGSAAHSTSVRVLQQRGLAASLRHLWASQPQLSVCENVCMCSLPRNRPQRIGFGFAVSWVRAECLRKSINVSRPVSCCLHCGLGSLPGSKVGRSCPSLGQGSLSWIGLAVPCVPLSKPRAAFWK